jgi:hypothetical protein
MINGYFTAALKECVRVRTEQLPPEEELSADVHTIICQLRLDQITYRAADIGLALLGQKAQHLGNLGFVAELYARRIQLCDQFGPVERSDQLLSAFFDEIECTAIVFTHFLLLLAERARFKRGPRAAIPLYQAALGQLGKSDQEAPCLHEVLCRWLASALEEDRRRDEALAVLNSMNIPTGLYTPEMLMERPHI